MLTAAMSNIRPDITEKVRALGYDVIETTPYPGQTDNPEATHADMQALSLPEGELILIKGNDGFNQKAAARARGRVTYTREPIGEFAYPQCAKLNAAIVGRKVIANMDILDKNAAQRVSFLGYSFINVKQGYAKCSVCIVDDDSIITSDPTIANAASLHGIDVLKISSGHIELCERYGGFIGGASFLHENTLVFFGDIKKHPDHAQIERFCRDRGVYISSLSNEPLFDIGGVVVF